MGAPETTGPAIEVVQSPYRSEIDRIVAQGTPPVLQVGARTSVLELKTRNWRSLFAGRPFIGADIEAGDNVDVVADICGDLRGLRQRLGIFQFGTIICAHVFEHLQRPWVAAENIEKLLMPGGLLFVQVPWVQAYHPYPEDYWRFSFAGIRALFRQIDFTDGFYSGGSSDVACRIKSNTAAPVPGEVESRLFQVLLSAEDNRAFLGGLKDPRMSLSRGYMPVTVVNLVGNKL
ncbi:MAG: hypothetical protein HY057_01645 [Rhodospirillales bacterium]|nr:hypothetical protein [Rhodospirillales bacterium]